MVYNYDEQPQLFTDSDFIQKDEQKHLVNKHPGINISKLSDAVFCYHYAGAGACRIHCNPIGCGECEDFQSVVDDDTEEDDE